MKFIVRFFYVLSIASFSSAVEINCDHQRNVWTKRGPIQECLVEYLVVSSSDEVVTKLNKHDYTTIKSFFILKSMRCLYMLKGVEKFLTNLEVLVIAGTGLKVVKSSDLRPFELLKEIYMNDNQLEALDSDLFTFNPEITVLNFENNKIKQIGCGFLEPLKRLEVVRFKGNFYFARNANSKREVEALKVELKEKTCLKLPSTEAPQSAALTFECPQIVETTTKPFDCESSQVVVDLKAKLATLEIELNVTMTALTSTTKEFCERYSNWENEKCKGIETTTKAIHPDDQTESYIENVID